jgi:MFS family permease
MALALAPLRRPGFSNLAFSYVVNELGNWLGEIALAVLVFDATSSTIATAGLFLAMQVLPSAIGPALVARLEPVAVRAALPALYLGEAAAFVALAVLAHHFSLAAVLALAAFDGLLAATARALTRGSVAALLEPDGLLREGNSLLNFGFTAAAAVGPAIAGVVVAGAGADSALLIDAGSFLGAAALTASANGLPRPVTSEDGWRDRLRAAFAHVRSRPALRLLLFAQATALVFFAAVIPIEVAFAKDSLDAGNFGYGALLASWGAGTIAGAVVFARLRRRSLRGLIGWSTITVAAAYLLTGASPTLFLACAASVLGGAGNGVQFVATLSAVQELTATAFQARIASLLDAVSRVAPGLGFIIGGAAAALLSPRAAYAVAGAGILAVVALAGPRLRRVAWTGGGTSVGAEEHGPAPQSGATLRRVPSRSIPPVHQ